MTMTLLRGTFNLRNSKGRAHRIAVGVLYVRDKGIPKRKDIRDSVGVRVKVGEGVGVGVVPLPPCGPDISVIVKSAVFMDFPATVVVAVTVYFADTSVPFAGGDGRKLLLLRSIEHVFPFGVIVSDLAPATGVIVHVHEVGCGFTRFPSLVLTKPGFHKTASKFILDGLAPGAVMLFLEVFV